MKQRGCINKFEISFLNQGSLFAALKLAVFGMRPDEIQEREYFIK